MMLSKLLNRGVGTRLASIGRQNLTNHQQQIITKRWSGHNTMEITPSNMDMKFTMNWFHFYILIGVVPLSVFGAIVNTRANPELSEVPEGYEPRHWEYYRNPIARWISRYMFNPSENEQEIMMHMHQDESERNILKKITRRVDRVMKFYNDHRSIYFVPFYADRYRTGRDEGMFKIPFENTSPNYGIDMAYDPDNKILPTEGYPAEYDQSKFK